MVPTRDDGHTATTTGATGPTAPARMRMAELAERSRYPVATIKYYLREGLLPAGEATAATQATYGDEHLERLTLIRVLRDVGDLPIASVREVIAAIEDARRPLFEVMKTAHHALGPEPVADPDDERLAARADVVAYLRGRGWTFDPSAPAVDVLAGALLAMGRLGRGGDPAIFDPYTDLAFAMGEVELATVDPTHGASDTVTQVIVGTVVYEEALVALRRLAEEHHSRARFGHTGGGRGRGGSRRQPTR